MKISWRILTGAEATASIAVVAVVAIAFITRLSIFSPGPLNAQSSQIPQQLGGVETHAALSGRCGACHAAPWQKEAMANLCLKCHENVDEELKNPHNLHYMAVIDDKTLTCVSTCHTEHNGLNASLTLVKSEHFTDGAAETGKLKYSLDGHKFKSPGVPFACVDCHPESLNKFDLNLCTTCHKEVDAVFTQDHLDTFGTECLKCHDGLDTYGKAFDHNKVKFPLQDKHASTACADCHQKQQTIEKLKETAQDCYSCHQKDDKHDGMLKKCEDCHNAADWKQIVYDHSKTEYTLTGNHINTACTECHTNNVYKNTPNNCSSCHQQDDEHKGAFGQLCADCHNTSDWKQATFDHSKTTFPLTGKHTTAACTSCHVNNILKGTPQDCYACHRQNDKHQGALGKTCAQCHNMNDWKQVTFNHSQTSFPLTGKHNTASCTSCHSNGVLKGTPGSCISCHQNRDVHKGNLGQNCASCHNTTDWKQTTFDHSKSAFPLTGKHTTVACTSCHVGGVYKGTSKDCYSCHKNQDTHKGSNGTNCASCHTTTGWPTTTINHALTAFPLTGKHTTVACTSCHVGGVYKGTSKDCYTCHKSKDTHAGSLGTNCATCHTATGWPTTTINHALTAFPLTGKHTTVACTSCHVGGVYKGTSKDCYTCHKSKDTHAGSLGTNCATCHTATGWPTTTINHALTAFPLTGKHTTVACTSCHVGGVYKGTPTDCYTCHKSKDTHAGSLGTNCATCHTTTGWPTTTINHALTAFPLTGKHTTVVCTSCHVGGVYKGTSKDCYTCHKSKDTHAGSLGTNCATCHTTTGWPTTTINHALTAFPLTGKHTTVACTSCHVGGVYKGTSKDCYTCHKSKDTHAGSLGTNCATCHTTTGWPTTTINHALTAFPLTGKHTTVVCTSCHVGGVYKGTSKDCYSCHKSKDTHAGSLGTNCATCHTATGWPTTTINHALTAFPLTGKHTTVACTSCHVGGVYKGTSKDCYTCHKSKDTHAGSLGTNCATCHTATGWPTTTINHALTAFPLTGKHTTVACTSCHVGGVYKGTSKDCYTCHKSKDTHAGSLGTNCATCHTATGWPTTTINHALTAFPLTGKHTTVACTSCHVGGVYKGTSKNCYSCHKSDDDHNGRNGTDCARCHSPRGWD